MPDFRFLHAADIHLDSPLTGLARYEGNPVDEIRAATRTAFDNLIAFACREAVDFVVIAGDLFDGDWRDMSSGLYFARAMGRLEQAGIPAYVLNGNHDAASVLTKSVPWPANVHRFGSRKPETFQIEHLGVALHGWSFAQTAAPENLALSYPVALPHAFNIGVLHTSLSGHPGQDRYAPCEITDLRARGYDYWALGHVHDHQIASRDPHVVFSGNLQGRNIRETGFKGAVLVEVHDREVVGTEHVEFDTIRWARVAVDCTGCAAIEDVHARVRDALARARAAEDPSRGLIARVVLDGTTQLAAELTDRKLQLREDVRALASSVSADLWLEKLSVHARLPETVQPIEIAEDFLGLLAEAEADPLLAQQLAQDLAPFLTAAAGDLDEPEPDELRGIAKRGDWPELITLASGALRSRLQGAG